MQYDTQFEEGEGIGNWSMGLRRMVRLTRGYRQTNKGLANAMRLSVGRLGFVFIVIATAACQKESAAPAGEASLAEDGKMTLVSVEPVDLPLIREMNLIETGDFKGSLSWRIGADSPNGFEPPDRKYSSLEKSDSSKEDCFVVSQTWKAPDAAAPLGSQFSTRIQGIEPGTEYALEITATGAARVSLWDVNKEKNPQPLVHTRIRTYPGDQSVKRYTKRFKLDGGNRFAASAANTDLSPKNGAVRWHSWRLTVAPKADAAGEAPSEADPEEDAGTQEQHEPGTVQEFGGIEFIWCPAGEYRQGAGVPGDKLASVVGGLEEWYSDEYPQQVRTFNSGFWIGKTEITNLQWRNVMKGKEKGRGPENQPVTGVTWADCQAFAAALGESGDGTFALPTEAQWEYACRAGTASLFSFGDNPAKLAAHAWYLASVTEVKKQAVGGKTPNAWGLHDMHGNVWEWCRDEYDSYGAERPRPVTGFRAIRGGSVATPANFVRSASRFGLGESETSEHVGFRVVRQP